MESFGLELSCGLLQSRVSSIFLVQRLFEVVDFLIESLDLSSDFFRTFLHDPVLFDLGLDLFGSLSEPDGGLAAGLVHEGLTDRADEGSLADATERLLQNVSQLAISERDVLLLTATSSQGSTSGAEGEQTGVDGVALLSQGTSSVDDF